jgi:hypothetical protein
MTASSPVTMEDLVNGLILKGSDGYDGIVVLIDEDYKLVFDIDAYNTVSVSSDGLTITFGSFSGSAGPTFTGFTFNA